ncbi:lysosomal thioesterase PPT2-A-like [Liolophura sinensis]|uniref:lysosomal thioesterase PPT2-A-like n=1 Tax=Liolophura sinensis TaxID=3198878 RepID=UPI003158F74D
MGLSAAQWLKLAALFVTFVEVPSYRHVILMHGIFATTTELDHLNGFIQQAHPGTNVTILNGFNGAFSLRPMWEQIDYFKERMKKIFQQNPDGVHVVCFSQGGLICRGVLSTIKHNVISFVSLSSPQAGQYGDSNYLKYLFPQYLKKNIYRLFYTQTGQELSIANYWNDPHHQPLYLKESQFLAILNNQTFNPRSQEFKENFSSLKNLVLIGGPNDGVITPWQSSHFAFYNENETVVEMKNQPWYIHDWFGLKTLDQRGAIHKYEIPGVEHVHWHSNKTVFECCILPWLS